jgi:hypothetical protein
MTDLVYSVLPTPYLQRYPWHAWIYFVSLIDTALFFFLTRCRRWRLFEVCLGFIGSDIDFYIFTPETCVSTSLLYPARVRPCIYLLSSKLHGWFRQILPTPKMRNPINYIVKSIVLSGARAANCRYRGQFLRCNNSSTRSI